ncbi:hypothetical protein NECAME_18456 [Necator americanus]|uniref:Uncharacterized protein n=1 Tax=Necator americanus TaxID=51031 RepID=W2STY6_NECAM|nr:hypothetical protein NECAME_18456 [Necator americanus]ETN73214.1 hypothetical protein NECAME_18456 [Necator americanus]
MSNETSLTLTVSPGVEYTASVRVCWNSVCSAFLNVINTAFIPFKCEYKSMPMSFKPRVTM